MGKGARRLWIGLFFFEKNKNLSGKGPVGKFFSEKSINRNNENL